MPYEDIFNEAKGYYQEALQQSSHTHRLQYNPPNHRRRQRTRNVIRFRPPYSRIVETYIGKKFLQLIDTHFPRNNKFHKIFNRSTIKVSYGCMPNIGSIISSHNKKVLEETKPLERGSCNCQRRYRDNCPFNGECLTGNVMYEAEISSTDENYPGKVYIGITKPPFKGRLGNHERDFNNEEYANTTELSKEVWEIKKKGFTPSINWKLVKQLPAYNPKTKKCLLCQGEKIEILESEGENLVDKQSELVSTCRHKCSFLLNKYDVT